MARERGAGTGRLALLVALGVDNVGSGLFLPLAVLYSTRVVGLSLAQAGVAVTAGTVVGLLVPVVAGRLVDRVGPRAVVVGAQVVQAAGAAGYLFARGPGLVVVAAGLLAAGQQGFYSSVFALIADVEGPGPKDRAFAVAGMVRAACFGVGSLVVGALLVTAGPVGYRAAVAADGLSFLVCAGVLAGFVRPVRHVARSVGRSGPGGRVRLWADRPFLALIGVTALVGLSGDFFLVGVPVFAVDRLGLPGWVPGVAVAVVTAVGSTCAAWVVRGTRTWSRPGAMRVAGVGYVVWCGLSVLAAVVPPGWRVAWVLGSTLVEAGSAVVFATRVNALAEAAAPVAARGRYLAVFQYAFTAAGVVAPAVVALFAAAVWLPWLVVAGAAALGVAGLGWVAPRLPAHAVSPDGVAGEPVRAD